MRLSYYCSSCKKKNYLKPKATNRFDLQHEVGDEISRNCDHCGSSHKKHINMLVAEPSVYVIWVCIAALLILTAVAWYFGFIALITFTAPIWFYYDAHKTASEFNKIKVTRK